MAEKINSKRFPLIAIWVFIAAILLYTRFVNLGWGLPLPMHPDERNMVDSIAQLSCQLPMVEFNLPGSINGQWDIFSWVKVSNFDIENCFNPKFFAYGQFPLYLGFLISLIVKFFDNTLGKPISYVDAALALRIISAVASVLTAVIVSKTVGLFFENKHKRSVAMIVAALMAAIAPYAIQFSHFGTTESLLMFYYSLLVYLSLKLISKKMTDLSFVSSTALLTGLAVATKVSAATFVIVPFMAVFIANNSRLPYPFWYDLSKKFLDCIFIGVFSFVIFLFFSPHTIINFNDFMGSIKYESGVALGEFVVFYTRQFMGTAPLVFQFEKIFPYTLGIGALLLFVAGFFVLSWSNQKYNFLRLAFLWFFLTTAFMFAKWSRFMAPIYPLTTVFASLFFLYMVERNKHEGWIYNLRSFLLFLVFVAVLVPGIAYVSVYANEDVRVKASRWINENIPENSYILSETANVVDIPIYLPDTFNKNYQVISFNFYELDNDPSLQLALVDHLSKAQYIFVPSRRLFANHSPQVFPSIAKYYDELFSGKLGFSKVAEITSYPKISVAGFTLLEMPDETAEETWTVFDHPVVRIYKKNN